MQTLKAILILSIHKSICKCLHLILSEKSKAQNVLQQFVEGVNHNKYALGKTKQEGNTPTY